MDIRVAPMTREEVARSLDAVALLRIAVFAEFPYLYNGDLEHERRYLATYRQSEAAVVVGAWDGAVLVGASTGTPLEDHDADFAAPFRERGIPIDEVFYCAESVLLPPYRGRGIGGAFFDHREAHARRLGRRWSAFCAVIRPADHPARPADYRPLDGFWRARGYRELPGAIAKFRWKDHAEAGETEKALQFWIRALGDEEAA